MLVQKNILIKKLIIYLIIMALALGGVGYFLFKNWRTSQPSPPANYHAADDLANPKPNEGKKGFTEEEREGIDAMIKAGFVDAFRLFTKGNGHYTWWSHFSQARERNVGWRIDYFFVSESLVPLVKRARIHADIYGSDHCPVSLELDL